MSRSRRIAVMIDLNWPYKHHHEVFVGIHRYARRHGWDCVVDPHADERLGPGRPAYEGVIARATPRLAERAQKAGIPVVNVWQNSPAHHLPGVFHDAGGAGRLSARHLMARGFRRFGFLGFRRDRHAQRLLTGFRETVRGAGFPCAVRRVNLSYARNASTWKTFNAGLEAWIATWRRPIGIQAPTDLLCRYLADACRRTGLTVPDDVALVGTGNEIVICSHPDPTLTSIEFGYDRVGFRAAELLDRLMRGAKPPGQPVWVPPVDLVVRRSSSTFAVEDPLVARALKYVSEHAHEPIRVGDVAAATHATRRTLERRFRRHLDRSISREITRMRLERARRMLVEMDVPIKTVAVEAGFGDAQRLCEVFRRVEGTTPAAYRRQRSRP
jgi:LacI family transcriptional regulator